MIFQMIIWMKVMKKNILTFISASLCNFTDKSNNKKHAEIIYNLRVYIYVVFYGFF
jgi:hypothetical protein